MGFSACFPLVLRPKDGQKRLPPVRGNRFGLLFRACLRVRLRLSRFFRGYVGPFCVILLAVNGPDAANLVIVGLARLKVPAVCEAALFRVLCGVKLHIFAVFRVRAIYLVGIDLVALCLFPRKLHRRRAVHSTKPPHVPRTSRATSLHTP